MKKRISLLLLALITALTLGFASACKPNDGPGVIEVAPLKSCTVKIAFRADEKPADVDNVVKAINAKLADDGKPYSVEFQFIGQTNYITDVENKSKKDGLDAAFVYIDDYANLISRKTLMSIKPYLDMYGKELLAEAPAYSWQQVTDFKSGNIYAIPRHVPMADYKDTLQVRKDWMDVLGIEDIDTAEDYADYCAGITSTEGIGVKKGQPVEGFYANMGEHNHLFLLRQYCPGVYFPIINYALRPVSVDVTAKNAKGSYDVKNFYKTQAFIDWCTAIGSYAVAGYIPEGGPSALTGHDFRFYNGLSGSLWSVVLKQSERIDEFLVNAPQQPAGFGEPALYDVFLNKSQPKYVMQGADNLMAVLSYSKNPNETVDFLNWIKTDQANYDLVCYGMEGVNFFASEEEAEIGGVKRTIKYMSYTSGEGASKKVIKPDKRYAITMPYWSLTDIDFNRWSANLSEEYIFSRLDWEKDDAFGDPENYVVNPLMGFMLDYSVQALKDSQASVMSAVTLAAEFATGKSLLTETFGDTGKTKYQVLLEDLQKANIDTLVAEVQKQVDAFMASKG